VQVKELMIIERYSHVMHLVSNVEGDLRDGLDAFDVLAACFPAGTVSGAPDGTVSGAPASFSRTEYEEEIPVCSNYLANCFPNPFNPATTLNFNVATSGPAIVKSTTFWAVSS
jgi:hypothetical protein